MPSEQGQSSLLSRISNQARQADKVIRDLPVQTGNPQLPSGIENGVAELRDIRFGEYKDGNNKGKLFFMASGIVLSPEEVEGVSVLGLRTQVGPEPLCETPQSTGRRKSFDDHYKFVRDHVSMLSSLDPRTVTFDKMETLCKALVQRGREGKGIKFLFRTWKGQKQTSGPYKDREPRVVQEWLSYIPESEWNGRFGTGTSQPPPGEMEDSTSNSTNSTSNQSSVKSTVEVDDTNYGSGEEADQSDDVSTPTDEPQIPRKEYDVPSLSINDDLTSLVSRADKGDEEARRTLKSLALGIGSTEEDVDEADSWEEVAQMVRDAAQPQPDTTADVEVKETPTLTAPAPTPTPNRPVSTAPLQFKIGDVVKYKVIDKKTGKPRTTQKGRERPPVDCEVTCLHGEKQLLDLKNLDDNTTYNNVPMSQVY